MQAICVSGDGVQAAAELLAELQAADTKEPANLTEPRRITPVPATHQGRNSLDSLIAKLTCHKMLPTTSGIQHSAACCQNFMQNMA